MTVEPSIKELEDTVSKLREELENEKKEHEMLNFDLKEAQDLNKNLSDELDRLYENITHMVEENKRLKNPRYV